LLKEAFDSYPTKLATLFFFIFLLKQYQATGNIKPLPHGGGAKLKVNPEQLKILAELIENKVEF
jgi:transposase